MCVCIHDIGHMNSTVCKWWMCGRMNGNNDQMNSSEMGKSWNELQTKHEGQLNDNWNSRKANACDIDERNSDIHCWPLCIVTHRFAVADDAADVVAIVAIDVIFVRRSTIVGPLFNAILCDYFCFSQFAWRGERGKCETHNRLVSRTYSNRIVLNDDQRVNRFRLNSSVIIVVRSHQPRELNRHRNRSVQYLWWLIMHLCRSIRRNKSNKKSFCKFVLQRILGVQRFTLIAQRRHNCCSRRYRLALWTRKFFKLNGQKSELNGENNCQISGKSSNSGEHRNTWLHHFVNLLICYLNID